MILRRLGTVISISHAGNLILRSKAVPRIGEDVYNDQLDRVGVVRDVFGPVTNPFISVSSDRDNPETLLGKPFYLVESRRQSPRKVY